MSLCFSDHSSSRSYLEQIRPEDIQQVQTDQLRGGGRRAQPQGGAGPLPGGHRAGRGRHADGRHICAPLCQVGQIS